MKNILTKFKFASVLLASLMVGACTSETEDDLISDCAGTDLVVELSESVAASCLQGGSLTFTGSGGEGSLEYSIDGTSFGNTSVFTDLSAGSYTAVVRDENGCTATTTVSLQAEANTISFEVAVTGSDCDEDNGRIELTASGGTGNYQYRINGGDFTSENVFQNVAPGDYFIEVKDGDCLVNRSVAVTSNVTLSGDIMPIINTNCAISGCHADAISPRFTSEAAIISAAERIRARTSAGTMPPSSRPDLTDEEIEKIVCWVDSGSPNN